jgi:hypothetical protein
VVRLPIRQRSTPEAGSVDARGQMLSRCVLVIDVDRDAVESLKTVLELVGHDVAVAYDGEEGVRIGVLEKLLADGCR